MELGAIPVASTGYKTMSTRFRARSTWVVFAVSDSDERSCPPRRDVCVELALCDDGVLLVSRDCDSRSRPPMAFTIIWLGKDPETHMRLLRPGMVATWLAIAVKASAVVSARLAFFRFAVD